MHNSKCTLLFRQHSGHCDRQITKWATVSCKAWLTSPGRTTDVDLAVKTKRFRVLSETGFIFVAFPIVLPRGSISKERRSPSSCPAALLQLLSFSIAPFPPPFTQLCFLLRHLLRQSFHLCCDLPAACCFIVSALFGNQPPPSTPSDLSTSSGFFLFLHSRV